MGAGEGAGVGAGDGLGTGALDVGSDVDGCGVGRSVVGLSVTTDAAGKLFSRIAIQWSLGIEQDLSKGDVEDGRNTFDQEMSQFEDLM